MRTQNTVIMLIGIMLAGALVYAHAQWLNYPDARIPRTKDGKPNLTAPAPRVNGKPDVSGLWQAERTPKSEYDTVLGNGFTVAVGVDDGVRSSETGNGHGKLSPHLLPRTDSKHYSGAVGTLTDESPVEQRNPVSPKKPGFWNLAGAAGSQIRSQSDPRRSARRASLRSRSVVPPLPAACRRTW